MVSRRYELMAELFALNPVVIAIRNAISSNLSFKGSSVIAGLLLFTINLPSVFLPLFTLLAFLFDYSDLFNTPYH